MISRWIIPDDTYNSVYNDTERNPSEEREDNHGPYNVVFQELAKFTGIAEGVQKILEASDNVLGVFLALFLGKEILTNYCLRPGNTGNIFLHLAT